MAACAIWEMRVLRLPARHAAIVYSDAAKWQALIRHRDVRAGVEITSKSLPRSIRVHRGWLIIGLSYIDGPRFDAAGDAGRSRVADLAAAGTAFIRRFPTLRFPGPAPISAGIARRAYCPCQVGCHDLRHRVGDGDAR